jgi:hypothetical protein
MKRFLILTIALVSLGFAGCKQNITLDLPHYDNKVAVFCILNPDSLPKMYLNLSQSYYNYGDTGTGYRFIKNARVVITDQTLNRNDTLHLDSAYEGTSYTKTWFFKGKYKPVSGNHYIANINYNGKIITSETTVPQPVSINHFDYKKIIDTIKMPSWIEIHVYVNDKAGVANSYSILNLDQNQTHRNRSDYEFTSDQGLDGKQVEVIYYVDGSLINDTFTAPLVVYTATKATDKYITDVYTQAYNYQDPFSEPVIIEGNVNGGLGLFGSMAPSPVIFVKVR